MPHAILKRVAAVLGIQDGFVDEARRQATPLTVDCVGLTRENLGDERFEDEMHERESWSRQHCIGKREVEPIRDDRRLIGRRYRFENLSEAVHFKLRFDTDL